MSDSNQKSIDAETEYLDRPEKALIEFTQFSFSKVRETSLEKRPGGRPPHLKMVSWWTKKPLIFTIAFIEGYMFQENNGKIKYLHQIRRIKETKLNVQCLYR
jgi:adenine-specific DNA methylase